MSNLNLFLEGLTFPNYVNDSSKKNFRLLFDLEYFDEKEELTTSLVSMPEADQWQWRSDKLPYFFPIKTSTADSVQLDLSVFDKNAGFFSETDQEIIFKKGKLRKIKVTIMDINDPSFGDHLVKAAKYVIPELLKAASGGIVPLIGAKVVATIAKKFIEEDLSDILLKQIKASGDKVLFRGGRLVEDNKNNIEIDGDGKKGKYKVTVKYR